MTIKRPAPTRPGVVAAAQPVGETRTGLVESMRLPLAMQFHTKVRQRLGIITPLQLDIAKENAIATEAATWTKFVDGTHFTPFSLNSVSPANLPPR
jgi:hypothetical protein